MKIALYKILKDFGVTRQTFYEMNQKANVFQKTSRGIYDIPEDSYHKLKTYYEVKKAKFRPKRSRGGERKQDQ